jgi:hypothetical protein
MLALTWMLGLLAAFAAIFAVPRPCSLLVRSLVHHWRNAPASGSAFNPLLEFVQPQACHVVEVREQALKQDGSGAPPDDAMNQSAP